jgi:hypothetical protein
MDEWLEALVMERLDTLGYDRIEVEDVEDNWDAPSIEHHTKKLTAEIDAAIVMAVNDLDPEDEEEEEDDEDEDDDEVWPEDDDESEEEEERWAARA